MDTEEAREGQTEKIERQPYRMHLPGFITTEDGALVQEMAHFSHSRSA